MVLNTEVSQTRRRSHWRSANSYRQTRRHSEKLAPFLCVSTKDSIDLQNKLTVNAILYFQCVFPLFRPVQKAGCVMARQLDRQLDAKRGGTEAAEDSRPEDQGPKTFLPGPG